MTTILDDIHSIATELGWSKMESKQPGMVSFAQESCRINLWYKKKNNKLSIRVPQRNIIIKNFLKANLKSVLIDVNNMIVQPEGE